LDGVCLTITDEVIPEIAKRTVETKAGTRALRSFLQDIMPDVIYSIPRDDRISEVVISKDVFDEKEKPQFIMKEQIFRLSLP
jgi:ATP-dependent Clp protease ATP-binding subunit ClpX